MILAPGNIRSSSFLRVEYLSFLFSVRFAPAFSASHSPSGEVASSHRTCTARQGRCRPHQRHKSSTPPFFAFPLCYFVSSAKRPAEGPPQRERVVFKTNLHFSLNCQSPLLIPEHPGWTVVVLSKNRLKNYSYRGSNPFFTKGFYSNRGSNARFKRENLFEPLFASRTPRGRFLSPSRAAKPTSPPLLSSFFFLYPPLRVHPCHPRFPRPINPDPFSNNHYPPFDFRPWTIHYSLFSTLYHP